MVDGLVAFASTPFSSSWSRIHHRHHLSPFPSTASPIHCSPPCQRQLMGCWVNCSLKLLASSVFLYSSSKLLWSGKVLKAEGSCSTILGFRVYSGRSASPSPAKIGVEGSVSSPTAADRLGSRLACYHFGLRKAAYRWGVASSRAAPPPSPLTVHITTRSLKKESSGLEGEVEENSSPRSCRQPGAPPRKKSVKTLKATSNSSGKESPQHGEVVENSSLRSSKQPAEPPKKRSVRTVKATGNSSSKEVPHCGDVLEDLSSRSTRQPAVPPKKRSVRTVKATSNSSSKEVPQRGDVLENSSPRSTRQPAVPFTKRSVSTVKASSNSSSKGVPQRGAALQEGGEPSSAAGGKSKRVAIKPKIQVSGGKDEWSGNESSLDGNGSPTFRRIKASSSKQVGAKIVIVGSDIPISNNSKPFEGGKLSKEQNSVKRSISEIATASASIVSDLPLDLGGSKVIPVASSAMMNSNQNSNRPQQAAVESKPKQPTEKKPKKKDFPAEAMLRRDLNMCSKDGDVLRALDMYDKSVAEGVMKWNQYNFNILLYLCSSAAIGTLTARKSGTDRANVERLNLKSTEQNADGTVPVESSNGVEQQDRGTNGETKTGEGATTTPIVLSPDVMELAAQRGFEIFEDMKRQGVPPNEATLTAVARLAIKKEDGDLAFQMVKEMAAQNIAPKLRSYSPAIVTFCKSKAVVKAFEVDAHMLGAGVQPEEPELGALLQLCVELELEKEVYSLLHRLRARVRALSPNTISAIEEWFSGQAGASAGEKDKQPEISAIDQAMIAGGGGWHGLGWLGKGEWKLEWTTIDSEGFCRSCKKKLVTIDLDPIETENFAQSVAELAFARETKSNDFRRFQEWLERHGPFDAIIDGANVGLYNQNFHQGGFNFFQLNSVAQGALDRGLVKKPPLIILHHARTKFGAANSPLGQQLLRKWSSSNTLYTTPNGSNDDWYWMYAAVRNKSLLITNDEMRDHLFQLLGSDFFPKWKERHQARFSATNRGPQFHLPPPYSLVIQESENSSWHIPKAGGNDVDSPHEWMCVTRPGLTSDKAAVSVSGPATTPIPHDVVIETCQTGTSLKVDSAESDGINMASSHPKRSRAHSPSTTLKKIRAADKKSDSGPVMFNI